MRGTGGLHLSADDCRTDVPGLFAAGDVATRELICGGFTGGASHNAAWAISSGTLAGSGAAAHALHRGRGMRLPAAGVARERDLFATSTPDQVAGGTGWREIAHAVQAEVLPYRKNYFRSAEQLRRSLAELDSAWTASQHDLHWPPAEVVHAREAAGMAAVGRWMYSAALARNESRGMHKRVDTAGSDPAQRHRLLVGGLDEVWTAPDPVAPRTGLESAAA